MLSSNEIQPSTWDKPPDVFRNPADSKSPRPPVYYYTLIYVPSNTSRYFQCTTFRESPRHDHAGKESPRFWRSGLSGCCGVSIHPRADIATPPTQQLTTPDQLFSGQTTTTRDKRTTWSAGAHGLPRATFNCSWTQPKPVDGATPLLAWQKTVLVGARCFLGVAYCVVQLGT